MVKKNAAPAVQLFSVKVPKSYEFLFETPEDIADKEENYNIKIEKLPRGNFEVIGEERDLESFADDITCGDSASRNRILDTMVSAETGV